jgi:hypothetical protein
MLVHGQVLLETVLAALPHVQELVFDVPPPQPCWSSSGKTSSFSRLTFFHSGGTRGKRDPAHAQAADAGCGF